MDIQVEPLKEEELKEMYADVSKLGFGRLFTDRMFVAEWFDGTWQTATIKKYQDFCLDPAAIVLHYGQEIFEGMKAYKRPDGKVGFFRPLENFRRFNRSAERLCMPTVPLEMQEEATYKLVGLERRWIPAEKGTSLYIRPAMIGTEAGLGVRASNRYLYFIILSPSGPYFAEGFKPVSLAVTKKHVRAVPGGCGEAKCGGNYASTMLAGKIAKTDGYSQVLWTDGHEHKYFEEVGAMNFFIVFDNKTLVTPDLDGSILPGITRKSVIELARHLGYEVQERRIAVDEVEEGLKDGSLTEAFGTGTAAVISPVGKLQYGDVEYVINDNQVGPIAQKLYDELTAIQYGEREDPFGWTYTIE